MNQSKMFQDLMLRVRAGEPQAAEELVRQYEPQIRRRIRVQMDGTSARRFLDSADIFQSVAAQFFVKVTAGGFRLEHPAQLAALLMTMARNKLVDKLRREKGNITEGYEAALDALPSREPDPGRQFALKDLFAKVMQKLKPVERAVADLRFTEGMDWPEINEKLGEERHSDAARKRLHRALDRVLEELGLGGVDLD